ncbi:cupin domain-containing protein [Candidatus Neomarinimicrobiota bacterium]
MKYVFSTTNLKRYQFPTHVNELVMDRSDAGTSEVFMVVLKPGQAAPLHKHDDTEQVFYVLSGNGILTIGGEKVQHEVNPGDIVRIPASIYHTIRALGENDLRYIAIDCFLNLRPEDEPTWDAHVKVLCREQGWDYEQVTKRRGTSQFEQRQSNPN